MAINININKNQLTNIIDIPLIKGNSEDLNITYNEDITNWKIRCEIYSDGGGV